MLQNSLSRYQDVNELLHFFAAEVEAILAENTIGIYLTGSLSYGAFRHDSSDIDVTVITSRPVSRAELDSIRRLHLQMEQRFVKWARRLECSYTPIGLLPSVLPPKEPRPWYWGCESILYEEAPYGNEWIINNCLLYEHGIALQGPPFRELRGAVDSLEVQKACIRDLFKEWEPKTSDQAWFRNSHNASYFVLNLCRILYTVKRAEAGSKPRAAAWVKRRYGARWGPLVQAAQRWRYGMGFGLRDQALAFLDFVIEEVLRTPLSRELVGEISQLRGAATPGNPPLGNQPDHHAE